MKNILKEMREKIRRDNRGLSLVEVLCAVAIFSLVTVTIGTVIVVSARTYNRGITETSLQQEAQLAANRISTIVQDACKAEFADSTLKLKTNDDKEYVIRHDGDKLLYTDSDVTDATLAEKIKIFNVHNLGSAFEADEFEKSRTLYLDLRVESGSKSYNVNYAISARNEMTMEIPAGPAEVGASIFCDGSVIMVPGEEYKIPLTVAGKVVQGLDATIEGTGAEVTQIEMDGITVKVDTAIAADHVNLKVITKDAYDDGSPKATANITVNIRRVKEIKVTYVADRRNVPEDKKSYTYEAAGAIYTFYANSTIDNPDRQVESPCDANYKNPRQVEWTETLTIDGAPATVTDYFTVEYKDSPTENMPKAIYTVKQDWPAGLKMTVRATSKHAVQGVNKADSIYDTDVYGEATIESRESKIEATTEITLEPNEVYEMPLNIKGGRSSDITFDYPDSTDSNTTVSYSAEKVEVDGKTYDGKIIIKIGNDEMKDGASKNYTFTIDVKVRGAVQSTITVHVRRLDKIWVQIVQDPKVLKTYDFRARLNVDKGVGNNQESTKYLIYDNEEQEKDPNWEPDKTVIANTLASRITWAFYDYSTGPKKVDEYEYKDSVICLGGVGEKGAIIGSYNKSRPYYGLTVDASGNTNAIKPARLEKEGDKWIIKQYPEIDLTLANNQNSLPANTELRVTIEMLHPQAPIEGVVNEGGTPYYTTAEDWIAKDESKEWVVYASASIYGNRIYTDGENDLVVVEPGQGNDTSVQSDYEMVIPIISEGEDQDDKIVDYMRATISGNSDSNTRLSNYEDRPDQGTDKKGQTKPKNPYCFTPRTATNTSSEWLLGLMIGKDEKGQNNSGVFTLHVEAYDKDANLLVEKDFQIAVRRVKEVQMRVSDGSSLPDEIEREDENKKFKTLNDNFKKKLEENPNATEEVTIEAYPVGYGEKAKASDGNDRKNVLKGTEYYDKQMKNRTDPCRWETAGHGEYKTPRPVKWTMIINGTEKNIGDWGAYIVANSVQEAYDEDTYKNIVKFTLKQPLPEGTEIRATSLHTLGKIDGKDKQYNKSGKEYDDTYGSLKINGRQVFSGFKRANRSNQSIPGLESAPTYKATYFNQNNFEQHSFFRYREEGGTWSQYYVTDDNTYCNAYITGSQMARLFRTDKAYELDVVNVLYNTAEKKIYWPQDESLVQPGTGWYENGYTLKDWDYETRMSETDKNFQCKQEFSIPKTEMWLGPKTSGNYKTIEKSTHDPISSESEPIKIKGGKVGGGEMGEQFAVMMEPTSFDLPAAYYNFTAILEKKTDAGWVTVTTGSGMQNAEHWNLRTQNPEIMAESTWGARGLYKISSIVKNMDWKDVSGDMFKPTYTTSLETIPLYEENGAGIIYIEFTD